MIRSSFVFAVVTLAGAVIGALPTTAADTVDLLAREERALVAAAERVATSVVSIETVGGLDTLGGMPAASGPASGTIVSSDGYIVASAYNFAQKPTSVLVGLPDGTRTPATVVATDRNRMFVLLKIEADQPLPVADIAPAPELRVGQWAVAVGRSFQRDKPNLSVGIISGLNRIWGKAVQTDARVSPSNYGGPLVDIQGRVVGLLVPLSPEKVGDLAGAEWYDSGIGFAVPMEQVLAALPRLKKGRDLLPGVLGITLKTGDLFVDPPVIHTTRPNSPSAKAGLRAGDRVVSVDGVAVNSRNQLSRQLNPHYAGDAVRLVVRRDGTELERTVTLTDKIDPYARPFLGVLPGRTKSNDSGVTVRYVYSDSGAATAGLEIGDRIEAVNGQKVGDALQLAERIAGFAIGQSIKLTVVAADGTRSEAAVKLTSEPADIPEPLPPSSATVHPEAQPSPDRPQTGHYTTHIGDFKNECTVYVPESFDAEQSYGLLLWLHGPGGFDANALVNRWKPLADRDRFILVAPKAADPQRWSPAELEFVAGAVDEIAGEYDVDPLRIAAHGQGQGVAVACLVAWNDRERIRGVAAVQGPIAGNPEDNDPEYRLGFYVAGPAESLKAPPIERLRALKYPVTTRELDAKAKYLNDEQLAELLRWFDTLDKI
ncbi:MAG TPA: PDZ domain-containing protein [Pirellulales bacterium]|nr:PDZ domain-containing protein [Pirellulales bacterium]